METGSNEIANLTDEQKKLLTYEVLTAPYRHEWETYEQFKEREKTMKKSLKLYLKGRK